MTYTIFAKGELTMDQCKIADREIKSGMIEWAYDDIVSFHDLDARDIKKAREIMERFGFDVETDVYEEHYEGSLCNLVKAESRIEREGERVYYIDYTGRKYIIYLLIDFDAKEIDISKPVHYMAAVVDAHPDDGYVCGWFYIEGTSDDELLDCCDRYVDK